jgi:hypothetical protein
MNSKVTKFIFLSMGDIVKRYKEVYGPIPAPEVQPCEPEIHPTPTAVAVE